MKRRTFLTQGTLGVAALYTTQAFGATIRHPSGWLTGYGTQKGEFGLVRIEKDLSVHHVLTSQQRLHGVLVHPTRAEVCAPSRRPGDLFSVLTAEGNYEEYQAPADRHYFGHGSFTADGSMLYLAENDYEGERGVIGVYDANASYKRMGEFYSGGIGPHQMQRHPDGKHLVVANGGILTHPDTGRAKLNLGTLRPSLSLINMQSGQVVEEARLPDEWHHLSIRHFDLTSAGEVIFGVQNQRKPYGDAPMVGRWEPGRALVMFSAPVEGWPVLNGYVGSVAVDRSGTIVAAASPRGASVVFWHIRSGQPVATLPCPDVCGVAPTGRGNEFLITSGQGKMMYLQVSRSGLQVLRTARSKLWFDNHCQFAAS